MNAAAVTAWLAVSAGGALGALMYLGGDDTAVVERVVDGDTLDVIRDGEEVRIRLLNVDTPESVDPNKPVECLGAEASAYLVRLLPEGTEVELQYDEERLDRYDRELAGVVLDDALVNAEIARAGYGVPLLIEPNDRFYSEVQAAWAEADETDAGLFSSEPGCTLEGQVTDFEDAAGGAADASPPADAPPEAIEEARQQSAAFTGEADSLMGSLAEGSDLTHGYSETRLVALRERVAATSRVNDEKAAEMKTRLSSYREALVESRSLGAVVHDAHTAEVEKRAEAERKAEAKRKADAKKEEARAEAERVKEAEREAESQRQRGQTKPATPQPAPRPNPPPPQSPAPAPAQPGAGYTGCRDYSKPGPYVDDKGRGYMPIDC